MWASHGEGGGVYIDSSCEFTETQGIHQQIWSLWGHFCLQEKVKCLLCLFRQAWWVLNTKRVSHVDEGGKNVPVSPAEAVFTWGHSDRCGQTEKLGWTTWGVFTRRKNSHSKWNPRSVERARVCKHRAPPRSLGNCRKGSKGHLGWSPLKQD